MKSRRSQLLALSVVVAMCLLGQALAGTIECQGVATKVKAVTDPNYHLINTKYQLDDPNLETLLATEVKVSGKAPSCLIAHFSALARITDNYVVFQVRVDGVPMEGHLSGIGGISTPVVVTLIDEQDEQLSDPTKVLAYNFLKKVDPGTHVVEVMVAAGSNIVAPYYPSVYSPVLTLEYH